MNPKTLIAIQRELKIFALLLFVLALTGCSTTEVTKSGTSFFEYHGFLQIIGWLVFPRLMFIFFSAMTGGFFFWAGVICIPRIMIAFWATTYYWNTNPTLCVFVIIWALVGETGEKVKTLMHLAKNY